MKHPMTKLAVAAAIIAAVALGLTLFVNTGTTTGVVWADVLKNVEASPGVVFRIRKTGSGDPNDQWPNGYSIMQRNATLSRLDWYRGDEIRRTVYFDLAGKITIWVAHDADVYNRETLTDEKIQKMQGNEGGWTDPQALVNLCLSHAIERKGLGRKMIDGVLCEGLEGRASDDGSSPIPKNVTGRLWVSVDTGYPVRLVVENYDQDGSISGTQTIDKFEWNSNLSPENVEPEIPADYRALE